MPEICRFYGIVIRMNYNDHNPPHFHVYYGEFAAVVDIRNQQVIGGKLPPRALGMVLEWAARYEAELIDDWRRARNHEPLLPIEPLL